MTITTIIPIILIAAMIFFMQRTQKKQAQERQKQLSTIQKGDQIVTIGGLYGLVDEVNEDAKTIVLDIDGIYLTFELSAIKRVVAKAETSKVVEVEEVIETTDGAVEAKEEIEEAIIEEK